MIDGTDALSELEQRMRDVLLQLAMISQGRTASWNSGGGGEGEHDDAVVNAVIRGLGRDEDPVGHYARRWDAADSDDERELVFHQAAKQLGALRGEGGSVAAHAAPAETLEELHARILDVGEGWEAQAVADHFRCGVTTVRKARAAAGRETERGTLPINGRALSREERAAAIQRLAAQGMNATQIARSLDGVSYSTVLRELGTKAR